MKVHTLRTLLAGVLALMAALVIIYAMLSLRAYFSGAHTVQGNAAPLTDQQKLDVLASLKASSSPSIAAQRDTLRQLSAHSSSTISEQQKLDVLRSLQGK